MSTLTDDEYTCLMIMAEGQNLIAMQNTRWHDPLLSLAAKDFCKGIGNNNYVITQRGHHALQGHEESLTGDLRQVITKQGQINESRIAVHSKMQHALTEMVSAARMAALTTGKSEKSCFHDMMHEINLRGAEQLK